MPSFPFMLRGVDELLGLNTVGREVADDDELEGTEIDDDDELDAVELDTDEVKPDDDDELDVVEAETDVGVDSSLRMNSLKDSDTLTFFFCAETSDRSDLHRYSNSLFRLKLFE